MMLSYNDLEIFWQVFFVKVNVIRYISNSEIGFLNNLYRIIFLILQGKIYQIAFLWQKVLVKMFSYWINIFGQIMFFLINRMQTINNTFFESLIFDRSCKVFSSRIQFFSSQFNYLAWFCSFSNALNPFSSGRFLNAICHDFRNVSWNFIPFVSLCMKNESPLISINPKKG